MDYLEKKMFDIVNCNADIKALEKNLKAISARRKRKGK